VEKHQDQEDRLGQEIEPAEIDRSVEARDAGIGIGIEQA
jgi:hypothetical protein